MTPVARTGFARRSSRALAAGLFAVLALAQAGAHAAERHWHFRALLDGREIGEHRFTVRAQGDAEEVRSVATFDVRALLVTLYRYRYEALERWRGDCLHSLDSRTDDNGDLMEVSARHRADRLLVEAGPRRDEHAGCVMSFSYWNPRILRARELLNSQTGELVPVSVTGLGEEIVAAAGRSLAARRYRLVAPKLRIDLWYAGERWVALESPTRGGRLLRYELIEHGGAR